jgi:hypothetical protein
LGKVTVIRKKRSKFTAARRYGEINNENNRIQGKNQHQGWQVLLG